MIRLLGEHFLSTSASGFTNDLGIFEMKISMRKYEKPGDRTKINEKFVERG